MTENLAATHITVPGQAIGTVGQTYDGVQCRLDPANGEIQIKSPATMLGYYKEPELTRRAFTDDGWMHTGDKGAFDAAGNLKITGRVKDLFKTSKGKYVLRHLARGLRLGATVSHAGTRHDPADPRPQRVPVAVRRQARRLGPHEVRRT